MIADLDLLELELRQLDGVANVAFDDARDEAVVIQLLVTDPQRADDIRRRADRLAERRLEAATAVELRIAGAPSRPLGFEAELLSLSGVLGCTAERGSRGEVRKITVSINEWEAVEPARQRVRASIGAKLTEDRLLFEVVDQ